MRTCDKVFYEDQAAARLAMCSIHEKAAKKGKPSRLPVRVYPCDVCDGWHLTAKPVQGRSPPWDRDPDWVRPAGTAHLQQRSAKPSQGHAIGPLPNDAPGRAQQVEATSPPG